MNNVFLTQYFDWNKPSGRKVRLINDLLRRFQIGARMIAPRATGDQTTIEQRMNMYHLASAALAYGVPGDLVELGTHRGSSAVLLQKIISQFAGDRQLHIYDAFVTATANALLDHFVKLGLRAPAIHEGWFKDTLPGTLPSQICFAHIDVSWDQPADILEATVRLCLESLYPRLADGAAVLIADYCEPDIYSRQGFAFPNSIAFTSLWNQWPAIRRACDDFFTDKPERMSVLYSGEYSHAFFRKTPSRSST